MSKITKTAFATMISLVAMVSQNAVSQEVKQKSDFWEKVRFGGGLGLSLGSGFTNIAVAPGAIYDFNNYFSAGVGLQGSYVDVRDEFESYIYGGSLVGLVNPIDFLQLSAELEQVRVNSAYEISPTETIKDNFWNTALFLGIGYRAQNITIGVRYNVLFDDDTRVYNDPFMPFVRVYF